MQLDFMTIPRTFRDFLDQISKTNGTALVDAKSGVGITYAELANKSYNLASRLNINSGDRVVLFKLSQLDWVISFFAIQLRGGIVIPIDERVNEIFLKKVILDTKPVLVITEEGDSFNEVSKISYKSLSKQPVIHNDFEKSDPNYPCQIIFTSGTWSDPKGVVLSQRNILANVDQIISVYPDKKPGVILGILPLSHAYQQTLGLLTPLALGSTVVFLKVTNSSELLESIKKYKVTVIPLVPRVLELLYSAITRKIKSRNTRPAFVSVVSIARFLPRQIRRILFFFVHEEIGNTLHTFVSGGAPLSSKIDNFFQGLGYKVMVGYGLSECSPIVSAHFGQFRSSGEVGKPLPGVEVTIDSEGEVHVTGENVFLGYWPNHSRIHTLSTGDLAKQKQNGNLVLRGRNKNLIIFDSGEKCFCEDLEQIVAEIDEVEMVCVVEKKREGVTCAECLIGLKSPEALTETQVLTYVKNKMPFGISLSKCVFVKDTVFPVTHTMKPNRAEISRLLD